MNEKQKMDQAHATAAVIADIMTERDRQIRLKGFKPEHDDLRVNSELAAAAACYAHEGTIMKPIKDGPCPNAEWAWPWHHSTFRPSGFDPENETTPQTPEGRRRDLIKAGALIVAEVERLDRLAAKQKAEVSHE